MTVTYNIGDRVKINWEACKGIDLIKYGLDNFLSGLPYYGTVIESFKVNSKARYFTENYVTIRWDRRGHLGMYGEDGLYWNLHYSVIKLMGPLDPKKAIEQRIKRTYAKSKLPFVQNWSK